MSAMMSKRSAIVLAGKRTASSRVSINRPILSPISRVGVKAASEDDETVEADEEEFALPDIAEGELLDSLVLDDDETAEQIELSEEDLATIEIVDAFSTSAYSDELIAEADLAVEDENSPKERIAARATDEFERMVEDGSEEAVHVVANLNIEDAEGVEDMQGPDGFRKYDEDEDAGISEEQRAEIAGFKLTKTELANLVPEDWDTINVDWFSNKKEENIPLPEYKLNFIWTERNIAVSVDQVYSRGQISPLTEFFFWPRKDAWEELRLALEVRPWISERDKVILLNRTTEVINFWQQEGQKPSLEDVRAAFTDCSFMGTSTPAPPPPKVVQEIAVPAGAA